MFFLNQNIKKHLSSIFQNLVFDFFKTFFEVSMLKITADEYEMMGAESASGKRQRRAPAESASRERHTAESASGKR